MQTRMLWKGQSECPAAAGLAANSEDNAWATLACSWAIDPLMGAFWEWQGSTVWDPLVGYVLEELEELGREGPQQNT